MTRKKPRFSADQFTNLLFVVLAILTAFVLWHSAESFVTFASSSRSAPMNAFTENSKDTGNVPAYKARRKMATTTGGAGSKDAAAAVK